MEQPMMYGEMVQELTRVRAEYEQFIINREQERIIKLLEDTQDDWRCREGCCECLVWDLDSPRNQLDYLITLIKETE